MASEKFNGAQLLAALRALENDEIFKFLLTEKRQALLRLVALYRGQILNGVELFAGREEYWLQLRGRLLTLLGDRGLEGALRSEMERPFLGGDRRLPAPSGDQEKEGGE